MSTKEHREIVALATSPGDGVLATLVRASGSSYRRPGARLLALADGRTAGTISGGCLEADLLRRAHWRVRHGAVMQTYDTGFDDTAEVPFGLGCGGLVDLLLEPSSTAEAQAAIRALADTLIGHARCVVTRMPSAGAPVHRMVLDEQARVLFCSTDLTAAESDELRNAASGLCAAQEDLFVERLQPAQRLFIFGAGDDVRPLTRVAAELGWTVLVADGRPQQATEARFPQASAVIVTQNAHDVLPTDAVVLMTHSFEQDLSLLTELLSVRPKYLGLLGARQRSALLLRDAARKASLSFAEAFARVHAPIGLELGGDGPESIALSIAAQVQAVIHADTLRLTPAGAPRGMTLAEADDFANLFTGKEPRFDNCVLSHPDASSAIDHAEARQANEHAEEVIA